MKHGRIGHLLDWEKTKITVARTDRAAQKFIRGCSFRYRCSMSRRWTPLYRIVEIRHLLPTSFCCYDLRHTFARLLFSREHASSRSPIASDTPA
jgi:integrase